MMKLMLRLKKKEKENCTTEIDTSKASQIIKLHTDIKDKG